MKYRELGKTGLKVSEIGFGGEWLERHPGEESVELMKYAGEKGINIIDCWMPDPKSRDIIGKAMQSNREGWYVQGHFGSTWQNGQYVRTRDMKYVRPAFEDLLTRLRTDYIDLGMIHFVDTVKDWNLLQGSEYLEYVLEMKEKGVVRHIGMSSHDPKTAALAVRSGLIEMLLFSDDGRDFVKTPEVLAKFESTVAYDNIYMRLVSDSNFASEFVNNVFPAELIKQAKENDDVPAISDAGKIVQIDKK